MRQLLSLPLSLWEWKALSVSVLLDGVTMMRVHAEGPYSLNTAGHHGIPSAPLEGGWDGTCAGRSVCLH